MKTKISNSMKTSTPIEIVNIKETSSDFAIAFENALYSYN